MIRDLKLKYLFLSLPVLLILFLAFLPVTNQFQNSPKEVSIGILLDLLVTIPVLVYLVIRRTRIPKITIVYTFIGGLLLASLIIPIDQQALLSKVKYISIPLIEMGIIGLLLYKISRLRTSLREKAGVDFYGRLLLACNEVFPNRVGKILASEIAVFYYLFVARRKGDKSDLEFTYFKKSGIKSIVFVFLFLISIETVVIHLLVAKWNFTVAWVLSFIGIYTMIQVLAILRSMNKRLITIDYESQVLKLRYGFACQTLIPFDSIKSIEKTQREPNNTELHVSLSLFDVLDPKNIILHLDEENKLQKIYGIEKKYRSISIFIDERDAFVTLIDRLITKK